MAEQRDWSVGFVYMDRHAPNGKTQIHGETLKGVYDRINALNKMTADGVHEFFYYLIGPKEN